MEKDIKVEGWMVKLWVWEKETLDVKVFPQTSEELMAMTELDLSDKNLTELPPEIFNLVNLTELDLSDNNLTEVPHEIFNLVKLNFLRFENNNLTKLPSEIGNLVNLTWLNVKDNELKDLPPQIGNLTKLTGLNISANKLTELPLEIKNLVKLNMLVISNRTDTQNKNNITELPFEFANLVNSFNLHIYTDEDIGVEGIFGHDWAEEWVGYVKAESKIKECRDMRIVKVRKKLSEDVELYQKLSSVSLVKRVMFSKDDKKLVNKLPEIIAASKDEIKQLEKPIDSRDIKLKVSTDKRILEEQEKEYAKNKKNQDYMEGGILGLGLRMELDKKMESPQMKSLPSIPMQ